MNLRKKSKSYGALIAILIATISSIISLYLFYYRFGFNFTAKIAGWVDTATYFNNLLSPIFLFITILLLYWTWRDTKEALKLQCDELEYQRINFERQINSQEKRDKLEIFSRRVSELSNKFSTKQVNKLLNNTILSTRVSDLASITLDHEIIKSFKTNESISDELLHSIKESEEHFVIPLYIFSYCKITSITLEKVFEHSFYEIHDDNDFIETIQYGKNMPDYFTKYIIAYSLISCAKQPIEIKAFYSLIHQIEKLDAVDKELFKEELLLNFDVDLADNLIRLNNKIPDNFLNE